MRLLLDTQAFIWASIEPNNLSTNVAGLILDRSNTLLLSIASVWEMQIKIQLGKLDLTRPLPQAIQKQQQINGIQLLPIEIGHVFELSALPDHHKDPFDRLIIAQARIENIPLITSDLKIQQYPVATIW